jgi:hypothetical protein
VTLLADGVVAVVVVGDFEPVPILAATGEQDLTPQPAVEILLEALPRRYTLQDALLSPATAASSTASALSLQIEAGDWGGGEERRDGIGGGLDAP